MPLFLGLRYGLENILGLLAQARLVETVRRVWLRSAVAASEAGVMVKKLLDKKFWSGSVVSQPWRRVQLPSYKQRSAEHHSPERSSPLGHVGRFALVAEPGLQERFSLSSGHCLSSSTSTELACKKCILIT